MASLISLGRGNTTCVQLDANFFWRLGFDVTQDAQGTIYFALVVYYQPVPGWPAGANKVALAKTSVPFADQPADVAKCASVALDGGELERDKERVKEAFRMFANSPKVKADSLEDTIKEAGELIDAYWKLRGWVESGCSEAVTIETCGSKILAR